MVINQKLLRSGRANTLRFLGSVLIIALCISMYVGFTSSMWSLYYELHDYREDCRLHDYEICVTNAVPDEQALEEAYDILMEHRYYCEIACEDGDILRVMSANAEVDRYRLQSGEDLSAPDDILLNEQYAEKNGYAPGDTIRIGEDAFTVRGCFIEPDLTLVTNSTKGISVNHTAYGVAVISQERAARMPQMAEEYLIWCKGHKDTFDKAAFLRELSTTTLIKQLIDCESDNRAVYIDGDVTIYTQAMAFIPFCLMLVACLVVAVILGTLLKSETTEIGILYSFGYRPLQLYLHYSAYPAAIALGGGVLGVVFGLMLAPVLCDIVTDRYCVPPFEIALEAKTVAVSLLMPLLFLMSICTVFILQKLRQDPLTLLRNQSGKQQRSRFRGLELKKGSFTARFRLREILRNIPRYLFMIFGVSTSALMLLLFASVLGSINKVLDDSFKNIFRYEYMYTYKDITTGSPDGFRTNLTYLLLDEEEVSVNGVDPGNTHLLFDDAEGNPVTFEDHGITIGLAQRHGVQAGDTLTLTERFTGETYAFTVDRIIMSYAEDFVSMPLAEFNDHFGLPEDAYLLVTSDHDLGIDPSLLLSVSSRENSRKSIDETLKPLKLIMLSMMTMSAVVSLILMIIVISIIIEDSRFTISMLKIMGYDDKRISRMLIDFNRYVVIIAFALSIPLILGSSAAIMGRLSDMMGMYIPPYLNPLHALAGFAALYLSFVAVKFLMRRRILAIDPTETLRSGE